MEIFSEKHANPKYSLITVNYRSISALGRMFRSLPSDFFLDGEILVVNNDQAESALLGKMFQGVRAVRILETGRNTGFSCACNFGASVARGEVLVFLNPDVRLNSSSLNAWLKDSLESTKVIIAPILLQHGVEEPWSNGWIVSPWSILLQNIFPFSKGWSFLAHKSLGWVSGAAFAIKKADFDFLGGFDEAYFLYYEDVDLCRRAKKEGFIIRKNQQVCFSHRGGGSHDKGKEKQKQAYFDSQDRYIRKHYGFVWCSLLRFLRSCRFFSLRIVC
ncbi:MAG: hypothetical protein QG606_408 [Patescibacteria group bacterium]|jgi:N-acetylglucosaminyl-diphospho-decaprenol L-rhamnosyltransferase|nr:hypothetical protein [Patescibacteria group bacterium]